MRSLFAFLLVTTLAVRGQAQAGVGFHLVVVQDTAYKGEETIYATWTIDPTGECVDRVRGLYGYRYGYGYSSRPIDFDWGGQGFIIFTDSILGEHRDTLGFTTGDQDPLCNKTFVVPCRAVVISDSIVRIIPKGWLLEMKPDSSVSHSFAAHSIPLLDNNISDTTIFSNFTAKPTNGASIQLQVFDSLTPITQYVAPPFRRKHILNLTFSSPNYQSFDTVIFSTRIQNSDVDSIISYELPVAWVAPASVEQGQSPGEDYALPNPFTTHTTIGFTLSKPEPVKLRLFDITGCTIRETERECTIGLNEIELDTRDLPPGCYWYVVHGGEWERSGKLVKLRE